MALKQGSEGGGILRPTISDDVRRLQAGAGYPTPPPSTTRRGGGTRTSGTPAPTIAPAPVAPTPVVIGGVTYSDSTSPVAQQAAQQAAQTAAVTAPTAAPSANRYPWLDAQYGRYFDKIQQDFADRGLLDSTNKIQPMTELADAFSQRYAQEARTDNQTAVQNAMSLWEMLTSGALQQMAIQGNYNVNMPAQPGIFSNVFNQQYLPPLPGSGPTGDAPVISRPLGVDKERGEVIPTYGMSGKTMGYEQFKSDEASAAANRAIQQAYLKLAQNADARDQATAEKDANGDIWAEIATVAMSLFDGGTPAAEVVKRLNALYDIDLVNEAYNVKNQRAIDILSLMNADEEFRTPWSAPKPQEKAAAPAYSGSGSTRPDLTNPTGIAEAYRQAYLNPGPQYDLTTPTGKADAYRAAYRR